MGAVRRRGGEGGLAPGGDGEKRLPQVRVRGSGSGRSRVGVKG